MTGADGVLRLSWATTRTGRYAHLFRATPKVGGGTFLRALHGGDLRAADPDRPQRPPCPRCLRAGAELVDHARDLGVRHVDAGAFGGMSGLALDLFDGHAVVAELSPAHAPRAVPAPPDDDGQPTIPGL